MAEEPYLLVLEEQAGENTFITRHVIDADNRQMVKYHYHRTLKDWGYTDTQFGKHRLEGPHYIHSEIQEIRRLAPEEHKILSKFLPSWAKV